MDAATKFETDRDYHLRMAASLERRAATARGALTPGEMADGVAAQAKVDSLYAECGYGQAPARQEGEGLMAYRARLTEGLKRFVRPESSGLVEDLRYLAMKSPAAYNTIESRLLAEVKSTVG